jgi:hypothetical protein
MRVKILKIRAKLRDLAQEAETQPASSETELELTSVAEAQCFDFGWGKL